MCCVVVDLVEGLGCTLSLLWQSNISSKPYPYSTIHGTVMELGCPHTLVFQVYSDLRLRLEMLCEKFAYFKL